MTDEESVNDILKDIAVKAGKILMDYFGQQHKIRAKTPFELVCEADLASEQAIVAELRRFFPTHTILTEEQGELEGDPDHVWIVDPLDGTLKFVLGVPYFSVSIAYEVKGSVEAAVVHSPYSDETFWAARGRGSFKDGVPLRVGADVCLAETLVCCDWGGSSAMQREGLLYLSSLLPPSTRGVCVNFSPALDLCGLAEGKLSTMVSNGTTPEDHSAGALIVTEAGGRIRNFRENSWNQRRTGIVATSTPEVDEEVTGIVDDTDQPADGADSRSPA